MQVTSHNPRLGRVTCAFFDTLPQNTPEAMRDPLFELEEHMNIPDEQVKRIRHLILSAGSVALALTNNTYAELGESWDQIVEACNELERDSVACLGVIDEAIEKAQAELN